jgi:DNA-nicking Smr family endonuclease
MKRGSATIPELPAPTRRRRALTEEERALWESVAKQIKPLRKKPRAAKAEAALLVPEMPAALKPVTSAKPPASTRVPRGPKPEPPPLAPIGRRERSHLSRGRKEIEARIDLHGMTQNEAHAELLRFLRRAQADGKKIALVVTGKGTRSGEAGNERGVLRRQVPLWLALPEFRALIVGFDEAHVSHGGQGALYVSLRRAR